MAPRKQPVSGSASLAELMACVPPRAKAKAKGKGAKAAGKGAKAKAAGTVAKAKTKAKARPPAATEDADKESSSRSTTDSSSSMYTDVDSSQSSEAAPAAFPHTLQAADTQDLAATSTPPMPRASLPHADPGTNRARQRLRRQRKQPTMPCRRHAHAAQIQRH